MSFFPASCPVAVDTRARICSDAPVKFYTPFLLLVAIALTACETSQNRRSLYGPPKPSGTYTQSLKTGSWKRGEYPEPKAERKTEELSAPPSLTAPTPGS